MKKITEFYHDGPKRQTRTESDAGKLARRTIFRVWDDAYHYANRIKEQLQIS